MAGYRFFNRWEITKKNLKYQKFNFCDLKIFADSEISLEKFGGLSKKKCDQTDEHIQFEQVAKFI